FNIDVNHYLKHISDTVYLDTYHANMNQVDDFDVEVVPTYIIEDSLYPSITKALIKLESL
ncbi:MAG: hypothetical protein ACRCTA_05795, partial [Bacilli bacterium]